MLLERAVTRPKPCWLSHYGFIAIQPRESKRVVIYLGVPAHFLNLSPTQNPTQKSNTKIQHKNQHKI